MGNQELNWPMKATRTVDVMMLPEQRMDTKLPLKPTFKGFKTFLIMTDRKGQKVIKKIDPSFNCTHIQFCLLMTEKIGTVLKRHISLITLFTVALSPGVPTGDNSGVLSL